MQPPKNQKNDVRSHYDPDESKHVLSCLKWLHHMATALHELHFSKIAHQDFKPSNVLVMPQGHAKLAGLSQAHDQIKPRPYGDARRDLTWAPPEVMYGRKIESFDERCASDMYQLGSLAVFMFTTAGLNASIQRRLSPMHTWTQWNGTFEDVLFYLRPAYGQAVDAFAEQVPIEIRARLVETVKQLSDPDPTLRGHPTNVRGNGPRYGFERFISAFDLIQREAAIKMRLTQ